MSKTKTKSKEKVMRKMISTTLRVDLWEELGIAALRQKVDRNDILEQLITDYLKKIQQKGR